MVKMAPLGPLVNFQKEPMCCEHATIDASASTVSVRDIVESVWGHRDHMNLDAIMLELDLQKERNSSEATERTNAETKHP